jgi:2-oxo-3-hexenedioate decarboxylase
LLRFARKDGMLLALEFLPCAVKDRGMQTQAMPLSQTAVEATAVRVLEALDQRRSIAPFTTQASLTVADAYRVSRAVTARRVGRGEKPVGRKIGFTNRTIWDEYRVHHPIDGPMYDTTVEYVSGARTGYGLSRFVEPRIEPEIVLGLARAPQAGMTELEVLACVHGGLICGPKWMVPEADPAELAETMRSFTIRLSKNGDLVDEGKAANVLDGPILALRHLVDTIAKDADATPLAVGDVITTGTLTRAFPVSSGERWTTELAGIDLRGMDVMFSG